MRKKSRNRTAVILLVLGLLALWLRSEYEFTRYRAEQERRAERTGLLSTPWLGVEFRQDGELAYMEALDPYTTRVELIRGPFEFRMPGRGGMPGVGVAAWTDSSILEAVGGDMGISEVPYFAPGTGIADTEYGSGTLYLNSEAHNYFHGNRFHPAGQGMGSVAITTIWKQGDVPLPKWKKAIYMVMFNDLDSDNVVDNGEYEKVILEFVPRC